MIPFIFMRIIKCTKENGLIPNHNDDRVSYVVKKTRYHDWTYYNASWMDDPKLDKKYEVLVPSVDITEEAFIFDSDDRDYAYQQAMIKMQQLWADTKLGE